MTKTKRTPLYFAGLLFGAILAAYFLAVGAANILELNPGADLHVYLAGAEDGAQGYFEPVSLIVFEAFRILSEFLALPLLLPVTVGLAVYAAIYSAVPRAVVLKIFWLCALTPLLSLVNTRLGLFFLFSPFLAGNLLKGTAVFVHWNYVVLFLFRKISVRSILLILGVVAGGYLVFREFVQLAQLKLGFYLAQDSAFGLGVFIELALLWYGMSCLYRQAQCDLSMFNVLIGASAMLALIGLPTAASRIASFTILITLIDLRHEVIERIPMRAALCLTLVAIYEAYLFASKTELTAWNWL